MPVVDLLLCYACRKERGLIPPEALRVLESPARLDEAHVGVRFGDGNTPAFVQWSVWVGGEDMVDSTIEAYAGRPGVLLLCTCAFSGERLCPHAKPIQCRGCDEQVAVRVLTDLEVRIERVEVG